MANDSDNAFTTAAMLLASGVAGYGASHWFVGPWLARRAGPPNPSPTTTGSTSSVTRPTATPTAGPVAPTTGAPRPRALRYARPHTTPTGPITRPSQVDPSLADVVAGGEIAPPGFEGPPPSAIPIDPYDDPPAGSTDPSSRESPPGRAPIDPYADAAAATSGLVDPYTDPVPTPRPLDPYTHSTAKNRLLRAFDTVFNVYRGAIPIEYLRALAKRESDMNPRARTGAARGLLQVVPVVLADYNRRHGTRYEAQHLDDPATNVGIACELLHIIIASYHRNHPRVRNLQADWANLRFVELLTFGWNAGYSEAGGVGRVTRYLEQHGTLDITIGLVHRAAPNAGASKHLSNAAKVRWCKSVAALYARERAATSGALIARA